MPEQRNNEVEPAKARLAQMREALLARQARLARHVEHREEPLPADFTEQASERGNDETMVRLSEQIAVELSDIDRALERLDQGSYAVCVRCAGPIEAERLAALPATDVCAGCARARGSDGGS